jgi:SAM-dependent methyltransferase
MNNAIDEKRERVRQLAAEYVARGDSLGWFDALYREAGGDAEHIPWADLEPNRFFKAWAERRGLKGNGRKALVVGCGLGDDAQYLHTLGFDVTAFDISPTAIEWAKKIYGDPDIKFETTDLFHPLSGWLGAFGFVLEIYTIQPLPMEMRSRAIDSVASFLAPGGELVVVCRGRENGEEVGQIPYPLSKDDLSGFEKAGLEQAEFNEVRDKLDEERRFVVHYRRAS